MHSLKTIDQTTCWTRYRAHLKKRHIYRETVIFLLCLPSTKKRQKRNRLTDVFIKVSTYIFIHRRRFPYSFLDAWIDVQRQPIRTPTIRQGLLLSDIYHGNWISSICRTSPTETTVPFSTHSHVEVTLNGVDCSKEWNWWMFWRECSRTLCKA